MRIRIIRQLFGVVLLPVYLAACQGTNLVITSSGAQTSLPARSRAVSGGLGLSKSAGTGFLYSFTDSGNISVWNLAEPRVSTKVYGSPNGFGLAVDKQRRVYELIVNHSGEFVNVYDGNDLSGPPLRTIDLDTNSLDAAVTLAVDGKGQIYVGTNYADGSKPGIIAVFAKGARGMATPIRTITGPNTELTGVLSIAPDAKGNLYVANSTYSIRGSILVFPPDATGNIAPARTIECECIRDPQNVALGADGNIYVANYLGGNYVSEILVFPASADGSVQPTRTLNSHHYGIALGLGAGGFMYLGPVSFSLHRFAVYAPGASGNDSAIGFIKGASSEVNQPSHLVLSDPWYKP